MGSLILAGDTLVGTTAGCRQYCGGVLFSIRTDGSDFTNLHTFFEGSGPQDGATPMYDSPLIVGNTLYGMTSGSTGTAFGTVYKYEMSLFADDFETGSTSAWSSTTPQNEAAHMPAVYY